MSYHPPNPSLWTGRTDGPRLYHSLSFCALDRLPSIPAIAFLGFICDEGVRRNQGRVGASEGPSALRRVLGNHPFPARPLLDVGDIICEGQDLEKAQSELAQAVSLLREKGHLPIILGGGHETAWGHYQGLSSHQDLGIVNFDAHFDLRPLLDEDKGSSGSPFRQIALDRKAKGLPFDYFCLGIQPGSNTQSLWETAREWQVRVVEAEALHLGRGVPLHPFLETHEALYVSLCLDVFAAPFAPGVSAPQPLGLYPWQVIPYLRLAASSGKVVGFDVVELCPTYDEDGRTAKLAAALIADFLLALPKD